MCYSSTLTRASCCERSQGIAIVEDQIDAMWKLAELPACGQPHGTGAANPADEYRHNQSRVMFKKLLNEN